MFNVCYEEAGWRKEAEDIKDKKKGYEDIKKHLNER